MRALVYADWNRLQMEDLPDPQLAPGEVLLKVEAAGICGSELEAVRKQSPRRKPPLILGHEFAGRVLATAKDVTDWKPGDPVVANAIISDGTCAACRHGLTNACENRQLFGMHRPGAFAERVAVPAKVLIRRQSASDPTEACLSEPLANGVHVANLLAPYEPKTVVVFGAGPIGLMVLQAVKIIFRSKVAVIDRDQSRLDVAKTLGADFVATPEQIASLATAALQGDTKASAASWISEGIDASVDAVGAAATKETSVKLLRPGGTAVWIGLHEDISPVSAYDLILSERRVLGSYACTQEELKTALDWIETGKVDVTSWISRFPMAAADTAFAKMLNPGPGEIKAVLIND